MGKERVAFCEPVGTGNFWVLQVLQGVGGPQTRADWREGPQARADGRGVLQVGADGRGVLQARADGRGFCRWEPTGGPQVRALREIRNLGLHPLRQPGC